MSTGNCKPNTCQHCKENDLPICCTGEDYDDGSHDDAECVACCTRGHAHRDPRWGSRTRIVRSPNPLEAWEAQP